MEKAKEELEKVARAAQAEKERWKVIVVFCEL